jgi:hypothetical protein
VLCSHRFWALAILGRGVWPGPLELGPPWVSLDRPSVLNPSYSFPQSASQPAFAGAFGHEIAVAHQQCPLYFLGPAPTGPALAPNILTWQEFPCWARKQPDSAWLQTGFGPRLQASGAVDLGSS